MKSHLWQKSQTCLFIMFEFHVALKLFRIRINHRYRVWYYIYMYMYALITFDRRHA